MIAANASPIAKATDEFCTIGLLRKKYVEAVPANRLKCVTHKNWSLLSTKSAIQFHTTLRIFGLGDPSVLLKYLRI